jgi:starch synthase
MPQNKRPAPPAPARRQPAASKPETAKPKAAPAGPRAPRPRRAPKAAAPKRTAGEPLSILMVASEAHPFSKTGGLAEVTASLSDALARLGHQVTLVVPRYRGVGADGFDALHAEIQFGWRAQNVTFRTRALRERLTAVLVDAPELFDRDGLYGTDGRDYDDNAWRFAVFSRAALEYARLTNARPSVIHAHDWQAGLVPVYQKMLFAGDPLLAGVRSVFTIHNLAFQGVFPSAVVPAVGLGWEVYDVEALEYWGQVSYLKGGVNFSEKITTVSPTYAREITQPDLGFGFEGVLARRSRDLVGILNGIDVSRWNPAADPYGTPPFSAANLAGKSEAKRALLLAAGLPADDAAMARPLIGIVSRLTDQKGFDLIEAARAELMTLDAAWVVVGSGDPRYERFWRELAAESPQRVSATIGFDERRAHEIEAGADMFLMPSRFEPCGLNQMYSLRYGTVPIVRATGGLDDTVDDVDDRTGKGTGFKFAEYTAEALTAAVRRAMAVYARRSLWKKVQQAGMRQDHSWDVSAREYVKVYGGEGFNDGL